MSLISPLKSHLVRNALVLLGGTSLARSISAVTLIVLARTLGVETFGQYVATLALLRVLSVAFSLGLDSWLLYACGNTADQQRLATAWTTSVIIKGGVGALWVGVLALAGYIWNHETFTLPLLFWGSVAVWAEELAAIGWAVFKAKLQNRTTFGLMVLFQLIILLGVILGIVWGVHTAQGYLFIRSVSGILVALITLVWLVQQIGVQVSCSQLLSSLRATLPFGFSMFLAYVYGRADLAIVAYWLGSRAAGLYGPAVSLLTTFMLIPASVYGVVLPYLSGTYREDPRRLDLAVRLSLVGYTLLGVGLTFGVLFLAKPVVFLLYGTAYSTTATLLQLLSFIFFFRSLTLSLTATLVAVGLQKKRVLIQGCSALFNILGNLLIVQRFQLVGVALMYVASEGVLTLGYAWLVLRWRRRQSAEVQQQSVMYEYRHY